MKIYRADAGVCPGRYEGERRKIMRKYVDPPFRRSEDRPYGQSHCPEAGGDGKKIMLAAHIDEIGLQVTKIEMDGCLRVCRVGWVWTVSAYNCRVVFQNGVRGVVPCAGKLEEANNDPGKLYIDIGCSSKEEALRYVKIGDSAYLRESMRSCWAGGSARGLWTTAWADTC